jgi:hypothetical protein
MSYIPIIPIEDLIKVEFLPIESTKTNLIDKLNKACKDGNLNKNKHVITFLSESGKLKVNTTLWMVGKKYVLLKENLYIPIDSIVDII